MNKVIKQRSISVRGLFWANLYADRIEAEDNAVIDDLRGLIAQYGAIQITTKAEGINRFIIYPVNGALRCGWFSGNIPQSHTDDITRALTEIVNINHFTDLYIKY